MHENKVIILSLWIQENKGIILRKEGIFLKEKIFFYILRYILFLILKSKPKEK